MTARDKHVSLTRSTPSEMVLLDRSIVFGGLLRLRGSRIESVAFAVIVPSDESHFSYSNVGQRYFRCRHAIVPRPECHDECIHIGGHSSS